MFTISADNCFLVTYAKIRTQIALKWKRKLINFLANSRIIEIPPEKRNSVLVYVGVGVGGVCVYVN